MIYVLILLALAVLGLLWYFNQHVRLPQHTDELIADIKRDGVPNLSPGEKGFVSNGDKITVCYERMAPQGTPKGQVLLLNGHSQTMLGFPRHFYEPLLAAGYEVIRMDNRGLGWSSWVHDWSKENAFSLEDMATDALAVLDHLGIEKIHILGYSMGGMIGQRLAISYPERVLSLTSMMTTGYYNDPELTNLPKPFLFKFVLAAIAYGRNINSLEGKMKIHLVFNRLLKGVGYDFDDKEILEAAYFEITRRSGYNAAVRDKQSRAIVKSGSRYEELKTLAAPTLVIHGTHDTLVVFEHAQKYAPMIPNSKTLFIDGLGHHFPAAHTPTILGHILSHLQTNTYE